MTRLLVLAAIASAAPSVALALGHRTLACLECHERLATPEPGWDDRDWREFGLCASCHDGATSALDVIGAGAYRSGGARAAGGLSVAAELRGEEAEGSRAYRGHTIGTRKPPPGFTGTWGARLVCKSCHAVHANGNFRNLGPDPFLSDPEYLSSFGRLFSDAAQPRFEVAGRAAALAGAADVVLYPRAGDEGAYGPSSVVYVAQPGRHAMNAFCASCHAAFHGDANTRGADAYVRHPTSGVPIRGAMRDRLERSRAPPRLNRRPDGTPEVACLTCHRAHGTHNAFGLVYWDASSGANGEDGAGTQVESLCTSCHGF